MDIVQIRTFLAVVETGSFLATAEKVHVTQSTVSTRIRALEERLGAEVFIRGRHGAELTREGRLFLKHATAMARIWDQARNDVGVADEQETVLRIGGQVSLWSGYLMHWLSWMNRQMPQVQIRAEMGYSESLMHKLVDGTLDLAVLYRPSIRPGFHVEKLFEDELVLVKTAGSDSAVPGPHYVYVNWGPEFQADLMLNFPNLEAPQLSLDLGSLGLNYVLENNANGYFPRRVAQPEVNNGNAEIVEGAPRFYYPAYAAFPEGRDEELFDAALNGLRLAIS